MRFVILFICVIMIVAILSTQNARPVSVSVFAWSFEASLAIIMFLSVVFGLIVGFISSFAFRVSKKRKQLRRESTMPETIDT